jgi:hypothetical protein
MTTKRGYRAFSVKACVVVLAGLALALSSVPPAGVRAAIQIPPPFDFSDDFYASNGIEFKMLQGPVGGRVGFDGANKPGSTENGFVAPPGAPGHWLFDTTNTDPTRTGVRVLQTTGGFDKDGNLIYYTILGAVQDETFFTPNDAGARGHLLADQFKAFIFPKQQKNGALFFTPCPLGTPPGSPAAANCVVLAPPPGNRRQDNMFETKNTYFCGNLLGLWLITFVLYTPDAANTLAGQQALMQLEAKNGTSLDGTPVLKRQDEVEDLVKGGFAQLLFLPPEPHAGPPRWVV